MTDQKTPQVNAFLFDSHSGQVCRLQAPGLVAARYQSEEFLQVAKANLSPDSRGSKRLRQKYGVQLEGVTCGARPFDFATFAYALQVNTYHARAVRAKAKDIVGGPWRIVGEGTKAMKDRVEGFFRNAFGSRGFRDSMLCVWTDYESLGNGYIEVIPTLRGDEPAELAHVPAAEMWVRLDGNGFVQQMSGQYSHFRAFAASGKTLDLPEEDPLLREGVNEVMHFSRYSPLSPFYGIPSIMPAWNALTISTLIAEYNLQFFSNNAIPDFAVVVEGDLGEDSADIIREYFKRHLKGKAHKTLVLESPNGTKIRFEKLTSDNAKEGSFRLLRTDCRDEVLHAHGVPPQKVGIVETGALGGNLATEQKQEYKNSIVTPGREAVEARFNKLIEFAFKVKNVAFEFEPYDAEDRLLNSQVDSAYLDRRVLLPNEVRAERYPHFEPLDGGDEPLSGGDPFGADALQLAVVETQRELRKLWKGGKP